MLGEDSDLLAIAVPSSVRVAGGITIGAGLCAVVNGLQLVLVMLLPRMLQAVALVAFALGAACVFCGWGVVRGRFGAAVAAVIATSSAALAAALWIVYALLHGVVSLTAFAMLSLSTVSIFLVTLALKDIKRIEEARTRLRAQGLDGGF